MHSADHPGLQLISLRLEGSNYNDWNVAMSIAIDAKNKIGLIDGSLTRPNIYDPTFGCGQDAIVWLNYGY